MSGTERYLRILSALLPAGILGMSVLLGSTGAHAARELPAGAPTSSGPQVAERLAAIRAAVSDVGLTDGSMIQALDGTEQVAWLNAWNNGPWGNNWKNWKNNWGNGWKNGGGAWKNGGGGAWLNF